MKCSPPKTSPKEAVFGMYLNNLYCASKGFFPFRGKNKKELRKKRLNDFNRSVRKILANNRALLMNEGKCVCLDKKEERLQQLCDEIIDILLSRKKDLREMEIDGNSEHFLFLDQIFNFFLSEKNLPSFINLIFSLVNGGSIFTKEGDYEKDREWLDGFEFRIGSH